MLWSTEKEPDSLEPEAHIIREGSLRVLCEAIMLNSGGCFQMWDWSLHEVAQ